MLRVHRCRLFLLDAEENRVKVSSVLAVRLGDILKRERTWLAAALGCGALAPSRSCCLTSAFDLPRIKPRHCLEPQWQTYVGTQISVDEARAAARLPRQPRLKRAPSYHISTERPKIVVVRQLCAGLNRLRRENAHTPLAWDARGEHNAM